jgi:hypothetical protein
MAATSSVFVAAGALALEAAGVMVGNVVARSMRQSLVPAELQGRVASAYQVLILGSLPAGGLVGGLLASSIGLRATFALAACLQVSVLATLAPRLIARVDHLRPKATLDLAHASVIPV